MRALIASVAVALTFSVAAAAQDDEIMAQFDAYNAAMAEGRTDDAVAAGTAAWRGAEEAWGDSRETAVLAYNISSLLVRLGRSEEALEPAARSLALAEAGVAQGDVPTEDAALVLGLAEFAVGGGDAMDHLMAGLEGRSDQPAEIDDLVAIGWISAALEARGRERWNVATERARNAREAATRLGPDYIGLVVDAANMEAVSAIEDDEWADARSAYREALRAYPAEAQPATDARLAGLMAWEFATALVMKTQYELQRRTGTNLDPTDENRRFEEEGPIRAQPRCYSWIEPKTEPVFPADAAYTGAYGAVLMAYDVSLSGEVENLRVAATAPADLSDAFIREIMEDVPTWRAEVPAGANDACLKNQVQAFGFYFE